MAPTAVDLLGLPNGRHREVVRATTSRAGVVGHVAFRNPQPVLEQLNARLESDAKGSDQIRKQVARLRCLLAQKATEPRRGVVLPPGQ
jgi:hypothetical protein